MILFLSACVGLTWILKYSTALNSIRKRVCKLHPKIAELFKCSLCLGFWSGAVIGLFGVSVGYITWEIVLFPLASSALSWFFDSLICCIQTWEIKGERDIDSNK